MKISVKKPKITIPVVQESRKYIIKKLYNFLK